MTLVQKEGYRLLARVVAEGRDGENHLCCFGAKKSHFKKLASSILDQWDSRLFSKNPVPRLIGCRANSTHRRAWMWDPSLPLIRDKIRRSTSLDKLGHRKDCLRESRVSKIIDQLILNPIQSSLPFDPDSTNRNGTRYRASGCPLLSLQFFGSATVRLQRCADTPPSGDFHKHTLRSDPSREILDLSTQPASTFRARSRRAHRKTARK